VPDEATRVELESPLVSWDRELDELADERQVVATHLEWAGGVEPTAAGPSRS
jgi:hypothetical protein